MSRANFTKAFPQGDSGSRIKVIWRQKEIRYLRLEELRRVWWNVQWWNQGFKN